MSHVAGGRERIEDRIPESPEARHRVDWQGDVGPSRRHVLKQDRDSHDLMSVGVLAIDRRLAGSPGRDHRHAEEGHQDRAPGRKHAALGPSSGWHGGGRSPNEEREGGEPAGEHQPQAYVERHPRDPQGGQDKAGRRGAERKREERRKRPPAPRDQRKCQRRPADREQQEARERTEHDG